LAEVLAGLLTGTLSGFLTGALARALAGAFTVHSPWQGSARASRNARTQSSGEWSKH
jgi:hypothetical protein